MATWRTEDYFDILPAIQVGMQMRQARDHAAARKAAIEAADDRDRWNRAMQLGALEVDPIVGPDGNVDIAGTHRAARDKRDSDVIAAARGYEAGIMGIETTPEDEAMPAFRTAKIRAAAEVANKRKEHEMRLAEIAARGGDDKFDMEEVTERDELGRPVKRFYRPRGTEAPETGELPGEEPISPEEEGLIEQLNKVRKARIMGEALDLEGAKTNNPKVTPSTWWHSASKDNPQGYDMAERIIMEALERHQKARGALPPPRAPNRARLTPDDLE